MGNATNDENWAARERLRMLEVWLWWRGWAGRGDLVERFGISPAQASSDFQRYLELNGKQVSYQTSRKRYEASDEFGCCLHSPTLEEAVGIFLGGVMAGAAVAGDGGQTTGKLAVLTLPKREATVGISRKVFIALLAGQRLRVRYYSLSPNTEAWRWLRPGALAWDGRRWHIRAWCETREAWRDFVLGRIGDAEWPEPVKEATPEDADWNAWEVVRFRVNPALPEDSRKALQVDYGLDGEVMEVRVRRALKGYLLAEMFIDGEGHGTLPNHFVME